MSYEEFIEVFGVLAEEGVIIEDGTWKERYIDRILNPEQAAVAAVEAIDDDEVMAPHAVAMALAFIECVPRAAEASALRKVWLEGGIFSEEPGLVAYVFKTALEASTVLMTPAELTAFCRLVRRVDPGRDIARPRLVGDRAAQRPAGAVRRARRVRSCDRSRLADWYSGQVQGRAPRQVSASLACHQVMVFLNGILAFYRASRGN